MSSSSRTALKNHFRESRLINDRLIFLSLLTAVLFVVVIARLTMLQVVKYEHFSTLSENNRVDIEPVPPHRGLIYDRNGVLLAENISVFTLELVPEKVTDLDKSIAGIATILAMDEEEIAELKKRVKLKRRFYPVVVRARLTEDEVARFSVNRHRFPGVEIVGRLIRHYPHGPLFAHTVGYVGRINEKEQKQIDLQAYKGTLHIGKTGVEKQYEAILHGQVGYKQIETNAEGRDVRELQRQPSVSGQDIYLHLDINLQKIAADALADFNGSIVALDPRNGGILAMVSKPDFDPNSFVSGISHAEYSVLRDSPDRPLYDRSLRGRYPPGSTLKPFVALSGLEQGIVSAGKKAYCPGWYSLPGKEHRYRCWKKHGHGHVDLQNAIAQSCDVYFYDLAHAMGIDRMHYFLDFFGFGRNTGIDIPNESSGLSPSKEWKRNRRNQAWFPGETLIAGIGQGFNQTTPLQLAHATATLAMRGLSMIPRAVYATRDAASKELTLLPVLPAESLPITDSKNWKSVIDAMVEVTQGKRGTARKVGEGLPFKVAGKTGTAQVFGIKQDEKYDAKTLEKKLHDHALFIAFAPADDPQLAIAIVAENGGGGSRTAAPIARKIIDQYFKKEILNARRADRQTES